MVYEYYYKLIYEVFEQLFVLGAVPLALLVYYNLMIYSAFKLPQNIEIQAEEEVARNNREKKLSNVLIGIVITFMVCHSTRIIWYIYYTAIYQNIVHCPKHHPNTSGESPLTYILALIYDLFLVINSSVNTIVYCCVNARFRYYLLGLVKNLFMKILRCMTQHNNTTETQTLQAASP